MMTSSLSRSRRKPSEVSLSGPCCAAVELCASKRSRELMCLGGIVKSEWQDRLQLSPDDYLQGVIGASNELVRNDNSLKGACFHQGQSSDLFESRSHNVGSTGNERRDAAQLFPPAPHRRIRKRPLCRLFPRTFCLPLPCRKPPCSSGAAL